METVVRPILFGLGPGAIVAALALGLVVAHRASGVINFAHGAVAAYVIYIFSSLTDGGDYPLPPLPDPLEPLRWLFGIDPFDWPTTLHIVDGPLGTTPALLISVGSAAVLGLVLHYLVFRPLRYAPVLAKVVASVGVMLTLQAAIVIRFGSRSRPTQSLLPDEPVEVLGVAVPRDRFWVLLIVVVVAAALWALYRFTRFGVATRAAADNERFATLLGVNADGRAAVNWVLACVLAGLMGILVNRITGITPNQLTLLVIPALGAALIGRMSSFAVACAAGIGLGIADQGLFVSELELSWFPDINLRQALPFAAIALAMVLRGEALPSRATAAAERLPLAYAPKLNRWRLIAYGLGVTVAAGLTVLAPPVFRGGMQNSMIGTILALSLVVVTGYVGQISLMQMAIAGVSAFAVGSLGHDAGLPFPVAILSATLAGVAFGLVAALPSLRTRGASLAIVTLASGLAIKELFFTRSGWFGLSGTSKDAGVPELFDVEFGPSSSFAVGDDKIPTAGFGIFVLLVTIGCGLGVMRLRRSRLGAQMLAVRANERAAAAAGINVSAIKLTAFGIASFLAALAGSLTAYKLGSYGAVSFDIFVSITVLAYAYLGGISTVGGAVIAGTLFAEGIGIVFTEEVLDIEIGRYNAYVAGFLLVLTAVQNSEGIDGFQRDIFSRVADGARRRRGQAPLEPTTVHHG